MIEKERSQCTFFVEQEETNEEKKRKKAYSSSGDKVKIRNGATSSCLSCEGKMKRERKKKLGLACRIGLNMNNRI